MEELRAALAALEEGDAAALRLSAPHRYELNGAPLTIKNGTTVEISSDGAAAIIDGLERSGLVHVSTRATLRAHNLVFTRGSRTGGGSAFYIDDSAELSLSESIITNTTLVSSVAVRGGVLRVMERARASLTGVVIERTQIIAAAHGASLLGGVVAVFPGARLSMERSHVADTIVAASQGCGVGICKYVSGHPNPSIPGSPEIHCDAPCDVFGGVLLLYERTQAFFTGLAISRTTVEARHAVSGGVINAGAHSSVTVVGISISDVNVSADSTNTTGGLRGEVNGGMITLGRGAHAHLEDVAVDKVWITVGILSQGGVVHLYELGQLTIRGAVVSRTTVEGDSWGAVLYVRSSAAGVTLHNSSISRTTVRSTREPTLFDNSNEPRDVNGGVVAVRADTRVELNRSSIRDTAVYVGPGKRAHGGCLWSEGTVLLVATSVTDCRVRAAGADQTPGITSRGAGIFVAEGSLLMMDGTELARNTASEEGSCVAAGVVGVACTEGANSLAYNITEGHAMFVAGGIAAYLLPTSPGKWIPAVQCEVFRDVCELLGNGQVKDPKCASTRAACSQLPDDDALVDGHACQPVLANNQPCGWRDEPLLLNKLVHSLPFGPLDAAEYPFICAAGLVGSSDPVNQSTSLCAGQTKAGTYQPTPGAIAGLACPVGSVCAQGSVLPAPCGPGTAGYLENLTRQSECTACAAGHWCSNGRQQPCPNGFYNAHQGSDLGLASCERCPRQSNTLRNASTSSADCLCDDLFFDERAGAGPPVCTPCSVGIDCGEPGARLLELPIHRGYWRPAAESIDVRLCPDFSSGCALSDDADVCNASTSGCLGGDDVSALCAVDLSGVYCQHCPPTDANGTRVYYKPATNDERPTCASCQAEGVVGTFIGAYLGGAAGLLVAVRGFVFALRRMPRSRKTIVAYASATTPHIKAKICISFYFIATRVEVVYRVNLPGPVRNAFGWLLGAFTLGLSDDVAFLTCLGVANGFLDRLVFWILAPLVLVLIIVVCVMAQLFNSRRLRSGELFYQSLPLVSYLLFFMYPIVTNVAFESFSCYEFDDGNFRRLVADVSVDCNERGDGSEYSKVYVTGWVAIILFPIGVPLGLAALLFRARHAISSGERTRLSNALAFLHREVAIFGL